MKVWIALFIAAAVAVLTPTPAFAAAGGTPDPRADVAVYDWVTDETGEYSWPHDISRVRVSHTKKRLTATVSYHQLKNWAWDSIEVQLNTDRDRAAEYDMAVYKSGTAAVYRHNRLRRLCAITKSVNAQRDRAVLSAPRSCLGLPRTVGARALTFSSWGPDGMEDMALDTTGWTRAVSTR